MSFEPISLGKFVNFSNGKSSPERSDNFDHPVFGSNGLIGYGGATNAPANTAVIGRVGSYCGSIHFSKNACWVTDNAIKATAKIPEESRFWYYAMLSRDLHDLRTGSGQPLINQTSLKAVLLPVPDTEDRLKIAAILGALDDKIELNRMTAATLEEMARALYRSWFVDFDPVHAKVAGRPPAHMDAKTASLFPDTFGDDGLPKGWEAGTLGDVAANSRKQVKPDVVAPDTPYIGLEHMPKRSIVVSDWAGAAKVGSAKTRMQIGQFLFGKLRPYFHKVGLVPTDGICSTDILVVEAKSDNWREFVLCVVSSDEVVEYANASSTGTRMPRVKWSDLAAFEVVVAQNEVVNEFSAIVRPWHEKILAGIYENQTLTVLRDTLLPRLMSGELRVGEARQQVEEHV